MRKAVALAWRGAGGTRPNPPVGAVVVKGRRVVGTGYHRKAGGPHAEIFALRTAGRRARGATLYVTLEPCSSWGRTGPCTEAILAAGIRRVVVACRDPNPRHNGRGLRRLRACGVAVTCGVCAEEGGRLMRPFAKWITTGMPFVTLKLAMTLDGRIADSSNRSKWITGPEARKAVKRLRDRVDAILVGGRTIRMDDPSLLPGRADRTPWRVVLDSFGALAAGSNVLSDRFAERTVIVTTKRCSARRRLRYEQSGAAVVPVRAMRSGRVDLGRMLAALGKMGVLHVLCEGGGELAEGLIRSGTADELLLFVAPRVLGGHRAVPAVGGQGWLLAKAPGFVIESCERVGSDLVIRAMPR